MFSVLGTFWGLVLPWLFSPRSCSLCGKWSFVNQWEFCLRANSKKSPQSPWISLDLQRRQTLLGQVGHSGFRSRQGCCLSQRKRRYFQVRTFTSQWRACMGQEHLVPSFIHILWLYKIIKSFPFWAFQDDGNCGFRIPLVFTSRIHCQQKDFAPCLLIYRVYLRPRFLIVLISCY